MSPPRLGKKKTKKIMLVWKCLKPALLIMGTRGRHLLLKKEEKIMDLMEVYKKMILLCICCMTSENMDKFSLSWCPIKQCRRMGIN